jgi:hypothetical protein
MTEELVITPETFETYFHDVRKHKPQKGQVLARYSASAEFIDGQLKQDILSLLKMDDKVLPAVNVLRRLGCFMERDCYRVLRQMAEDLLTMTEEEVLNKPYKMVVEMFYWTTKDCIPSDPHWETIGIMNMDEFMDKHGVCFKIGVKREWQEETVVSGGPSSQEETKLLEGQPLHDPFLDAWKKSDSEENK